MSQVVDQIQVNSEVAQSLGLLPEEFEKIKEIMGRTPNFTELSIFSVMWSEHCSYKNSITWLKKLPREGKHLLAEAGEENAGLVDIGNGLGCAFKIESHNHPSAIEPYQGAATGVGGIHRDIFTMGARPLAALNSLRFGSLKNDKTKHLLKGVVKGIGDYGNSFGVPTIGGEVYFEECYQTNPLVNAMSIGIVSKDKVISAISYGAGNPVYIVGSATGKDGIHGATFASEDITDESSEKLPAVQVGDPFQEKLLLEATLELAETDAIIGMQDMGAAGITCSTSEMSAKGEAGMDIWLEKVPTRQPNMKPFEILLSESQERMLVVVKKGREQEVVDIFEKWDLNCAEIGVVTEGNTLRYFMNGESVAEVEAEPLVLGGGAPIYEREIKEPAYVKEGQSFDLNSLSDNSDYKSVIESLLAIPNIASKRWIYNQYDSMVGVNTTTTNTVSDAAVIRIKGSNRGIAASVDCNGRYVHANPIVGAQIAVAECARNIACTGGKASAVTNCLNFGNPYNPEVYWQFTQTIQGMKIACEALETPVTGGNVSFYNQSTDGGAVYPTPTIGMVGIIEDRSKTMSLDFKNEGDKLYVLGPIVEELNSSEYLHKLKGINLSPAPSFDINTEVKLQNTLLDLIDKQVIRSAHDVSEGGLVVSLLESSFVNNLGFQILTPEGMRKDCFLYGESQSRVVISVSEDNEEAFLKLVSASGLDFLNIGEVSNGDVSINNEDLGNIVAFKEIYDTAIERA